MGCHRAAFLEIIQRKCDMKVTNFHFTKRLASYNQTPDSITLNFSDGSCSKADVLIGCDGIHSAIRHRLAEEVSESLEKIDSPDVLEKVSMIQEKVEAKWSGYVAYRGLVPMDTLANINPNHRALTTPTNVSLQFS